MWEKEKLIKWKPIVAAYVGKPIMAGDCSLYVGIGAIGKSTTEQQSGVFALQIVLNHSVSIFIQIYTDLQILFSISQYGFIVQIYTIVKL